MADFTLPAPAWRPDLPDPRDYGPAHEAVTERLGKLARRLGPRGERRLHVDLREYLPEPAAGGPAPTATARAVATLARYFERRATGRDAYPSPLFLHQTAVRLSGHGAATSEGELRTTLKALARFGAPPANYWPDDVDHALRQPDAFLHGFWRDWSGLAYVRLDVHGADGPTTLRTLQRWLSGGFALVLGCALPRCVSADGDLPFPTRHDTIQGGHALVALGYDDQHRIRSSRGALRVRATWGGAWGEHGDGWLPYRYVEEGLAQSAWTLLRAEWLASGEFGGK